LVLFQLNPIFEYKNSSMATYTNNGIIDGLHGKVGDLVFRTRGNKTSVYTLSSRQTALSEKQLQAQLRFAAAVKSAKEALLDHTKRKEFEEMAQIQGKTKAYNAAVSFYLAFPK
jgi:hypothetical protein